MATCKTKEKKIDKKKENKKKHKECWVALWKGEKKMGGGVQTLRENPMFSTTYQLSFIVETITFNCKMFFAIQKWHYQLVSKIVDNVKSPLQHSWKQHTCVNLWVNLRWQNFNWKWCTF
jgi:hypothetical protein